MKQLIILLTLIISFTSCSVKEKPVFLGIENIKVLESTSKKIILTADALFMNSNDIGGELQTDEIKVFVNGNEMASISTNSFEVPAKHEFSIPLTTNIPTDSLFSNKNLSGLLGSLFNKKIEVQYKGDITYKIFGFSHSYAIDETENINLKF
ncbi:LEA type 2 family protein [Psychroserpens mesophilus]|uniref:LEA type 2 family protein n=1 Tax=Psychroserpens mesophilus TaxID=325473 RepID=UPI003D64C284